MDEPTWLAYCEQESLGAWPLIASLGIRLDTNQVHIGGEKFLSGVRKLVLTGERLDDARRVIVKVSSDAVGTAEIERERSVRQILASAELQPHEIYYPEELLFSRQDGYVISVTSYIHQQLGFIARSNEEQFCLALRAFETQEHVNANTRQLSDETRRALGMVGAREYCRSFAAYAKSIAESDSASAEISKPLERARRLLVQHSALADRDTGFLIHSDFAPQNFRIVGQKLHFLDLASFCFGSKYESWARFLNSMSILNRSLEARLMKHVRKNHGEHEYLSLRLMRVYKVGFMLSYFSRALRMASGDLHALCRARVTFWTHVLMATLDDALISEEKARVFVRASEALRSKEETHRRVLLDGL